MNLRPSFDPNPNPNQSNYYWFDKVFSEKELFEIDKLQAKYQFNNGTTVGETEGDIRKSKIKWLPYTEESSWLYSKLADMVKEANSIWEFDLNSIIDNIQYTEYYGGGGEYGWHMDIGPHPINHRKISITIQLSEPDGYLGGNLELWTGVGQVTAPRSKGCAVLFPSFMMHRVTPVASGTRKSLVLWVGGGAYK